MYLEGKKYEIVTTVDMALLSPIIEACQEIVWDDAPVCDTFTNRKLLQFYHKFNKTNANRDEDDIAVS